MSKFPSQSDQPHSDRPQALGPERKFLEPEILEPPQRAPQAPHSDQPPPVVHTRQSRSPAKPFAWGYLLGGCLTVLVVMVGGMVALGFGSFWFYKQQVTQYTSEEARPLPVVEVTAEKLEQIESRVEAFQEQVEQQGPPPEPLILNSDDVNALISNEEKLRGKVFVTIEDGLVQADVSLPTDGIPGGEGRYFNGSVSLEASLEDGVLLVKLQQAEVNGAPVPKAFMQAMRNQNLAKDVYKNPELAEKLSKFERLVVEGDQIILTPKQATGEEPQPEMSTGGISKPTQGEAAQQKSASAPLGM